MKKNNSVVVIIVVLVLLFLAGSIGAHSGMVTYTYPGKAYCSMIEVDGKVIYELTSDHCDTGIFERAESQGFCIHSAVDEYGKFEDMKITECKYR